MSKRTMIFKGAQLPSSPFHYRVNFQNVPEEPEEYRIMFFGVVNVGEANRALLQSVLQQLALAPVKAGATNLARITAAFAACIGIAAPLTAAAVGFGIYFDPVAATLFGTLAAVAWVFGGWCASVSTLKLPGLIDDPMWWKEAPGERGRRFRVE